MHCSTSSAVVSTLPTSTTNITGFLTMPRGSSLRTESISAWPMISVFQRRRFLSHDFLASFRFQLLAIWVSDCFCDSSLLAGACSEKLACVQLQVLKDWSQAQRREERKRAENQNHADQQHGEKRVVHGKVPGEGGTLFFWQGCRRARAPESSSGAGR